MLVKFLLRNYSYFRRFLRCVSSYVEVWYWFKTNNNMRKKKQRFGFYPNETTRLEDHSINTILGKGVVLSAIYRRWRSAYRWRGQRQYTSEKGIVLGESEK